jgi:serine/threonine protein kinase
MGTAPKPPKTDAVKVGVGDMVLERYRVVEQIASGGHSVVFRGTDERLSRPVCIKVFSGLGGKSGVGRTSYEHFVQEAFALSRLTHPNTLRIYDFGHLGAKDNDGMPLQVCEFMNGGTLSNVVREQGVQSVAETARVIGAMCAALSEAHALGIVHRDIKPQNILFGSVGKNKLPKLADFGIAKWSGDDETEHAKQRAEDTAIVAGQKLAMYSPSWAAPEQLAGQPVSAATDIYSLAVVAVYMLSGKAIFAEEDVYAGYKKRRHSDDLVREALKPHDVPKNIVKLLSKALAFDPKQRLSNVDELARELSEIEPPTPVVATTSAANDALLTPTVPNAAITPPAGSPTVDKKPVPATAPNMPPVASGWSPPTPTPPWMTSAPNAAGNPHRLALTDQPMSIAERSVHFVHSTTNVADLTGGQGRVRITYMSSPTHARLIHIKGLSCFIAHVGGRPSPAVTLEQPSDIALVTPRAQEIGHLRVATGVHEVQASGNHLVFALGSERVAVAVEDCTDPILFDFGPGSDAYFVYTQGRTIPKLPNRRR